MAKRVMCPKCFSRNTKHLKKHPRTFKFLEFHRIYRCFDCSLTWDRTEVLKKRQKIQEDNLRDRSYGKEVEDLTDEEFWGLYRESFWYIDPEDETEEEW